VLGRLVRSADFERALGMPACARSTHFAIHHVAPAAMRSDLSTSAGLAAAGAVDESTPRELHLGSVVPKRHARRSVTRSLIKRQIRAAVGRHAERLAAGSWVVRLKAPFDGARWPSAASRSLRDSARDELDAILQRSPQS
jgi:ribonuclease P protein component